MDGEVGAAGGPARDTGLGGSRPVRRAGKRGDSPPISAPVPATLLGTRLGLVDAVDQLLNRGAVVVGDATLSLAGVDLVYVGLNLLVASVETLRQSGAQPGAAPAPQPSVPPAPPTLPPSAGHSAAPPIARPLSTDRPDWYSGLTPAVADPGAPPSGATAAPAPAGGRGPSGTPPGPGSSDDLERPDQGLARLVLTLVELLRRILERQAIRRMDGGGLSDEEVERMGTALMELEAKLAELRGVFELGEADLNLDLGPLGQLLE